MKRLLWFVFLLVVSTALFAAGGGEKPAAATGRQPVPRTNRARWRAPLGS